MGKLIEKGKPLPEHTKLDYEECYAKVFLEHYFGDIFTNLVLEDRPDLYDKHADVGIEVTECIAEKRKEAVHLWYTMPYVSPEIRKRNVERMRQLGVEYEGGIQSWPIITYNNGIESAVYYCIYDSLKNKLKKLNQPDLYKPCSDYYVLLFSQLYLENELKYAFAQKLKDISSEYEKKFSKIFVITQTDFLCIDITTLDVLSFDIQYEQHNLSRIARAMVEEGEKNDQT